MLSESVGKNITLYAGTKELNVIFGSHTNNLIVSCLV